MSKLIRLAQLASTKHHRGLIPASPATIWRWVAAGKFPKPVKLSDRVTAWDLRAVTEWLVQRGVSQ